MPRRIQRQRRKGWRLPANAMIVDRTSRWGNRYRVKDYGRAECLRLYEDSLYREHADLAAFLAPLRGKDLACACALSEPCHADVLLRLANA
jgi:Domain of unknown function (DUF4326)